MKNIQNLLIGVSLLLAGVIGLGVLPATRMSIGGMMGGGMMDRNAMKEMMGDILPPGIDPKLLPNPGSRSARLLQQYCTQCHDLPGPGMHTAAEWPTVAARMNARIQMMNRMGMTMMGQIAAPTKEELDTITAYLEKYAQTAIAPKKYPLDNPAGRAFSSTCAQCHALPEPKQHTPQEWPSVVVRMKEHESQMGRIVPDDAATQLITEFLQRHGRTGK